MIMSLGIVTRHHFLFLWIYVQEAYVCVFTYGTAQILLAVVL